VPTGGRFRGRAGRSQPRSSPRPHCRFGTLSDDPCAPPASQPDYFNGSNQSKGVRWRLSSSVVLSVVALGVLSTGIAYVLNYRLIQDEGPTAASMTNYLTPVVAVLLGIAVVGEPLTWNLIIGTAMILIGLWIAEHSLADREVANVPMKLSEAEGGRR